VLFFIEIQANDNPNAQKISITHPLLERYDLYHPEISPNDSLTAFSTSNCISIQNSIESAQVV